MTMQAMLTLTLGLQLSLGQLSLGMAATPVIGVVNAKSGFLLDDASVKGNGTLFEGTVVETGRTGGDLQMVGGATLQLAAESRGRIYRDRLVLERGSGEVSNATRFGVEARSLRVLADDSSAVGRILVTDKNKILVAALRGSFHVTNAKGIMLASLSAGHALEFEPPQGGGAAAPSNLTGCLVKRDGHYYLTDDTAGITVELKGGSLNKHAGNRIEVIGAQVLPAVPTTRSSQVIQVSTVREISKRCSSVAGTAGGAAAGGAAAGGGAATAAGGAAAGAAGGAAAGTVIAGVVIAAAVAGTAIAITSGDDETISR
ncbi:MAG: hypothetical protein JJE04_05965 [Acidobacteriia bacterium]|nr:hypothetical protein [Terriglobia bacterium]